jgi:hypothetical protein
MRPLNSSTITQERLKELLDYDPETGLFTWRSRSSNRIQVGDIAGSYSPYGYLQIRIDGRLYMAHRLAWLYINGELPKGILDHANLLKDDNRISNLRPATKSQNGANGPVRHNGLKGAYWIDRAGRWLSQIQKGGKAIYLGYFHTEQQAHCAWWAAAQHMHGEFARKH